MTLRTDSFAGILDERSPTLFERLWSAVTILASPTETRKAAVRKIAMSPEQATAVAKTFTRALEAVDASGDANAAAQFGAGPVSWRARSRAREYLFELHEALPPLSAPERVGPTTDGAIVMQWTIDSTRGQVDIDLLFFADREELHVDFVDQDDDPREEPLPEPRALLSRLHALLGPYLRA